MNKKQYNNVIEHTLKHELSAQAEDSLEVARAIFNNMGVALPQGDIKHVYEAIKSDDYMGWKSCTMQEAQEAANNGTATIGISEDRIVVLAANDEEEPVVETTAVMSLSENTSAYAVNGLSYATYSNGTTTATKENVIIRKDGNSNKVIFESSGKVWYCINKDLIYDEENSENSTLKKRSAKNIFLDYNEDDPFSSDESIKEFSDNELRLLYAIDPYGVAHYVKNYALQKCNTLAETVKYKDRIFKVLFKRSPRYFERTLEGVWYEFKGDIDYQYNLSESEAYFDVHPIYDLNTIFKVVNACASIFDIVFTTEFFTKKALGIIIKNIATTGVLCLSGMEATLRNELGNYVAGNVFEKLIDDTDIRWALDIVSVYTSWIELSEFMNEENNFNKNIISYCACDTNYNVRFEMKNGSIYNLKALCDIHG